MAGRPDRRLAAKAQIPQFSAILPVCHKRLGRQANPHDNGPMQEAQKKIAPLPNTTLEAVRDLVRPDLAAVDAEIRRQLHSDVVLIDQVANYIIGSGGKRLPAST